MSIASSSHNSEARSPYKWKFAKAPEQSNLKRHATGPRTPAGKAVVSQNARKHGLFSTNPVLPGVESEDDWQEYRAALLQTFAPQGPLEHVLAERAVSLQWRLRRIPAYEAGSTQAAAHQTELDASFLHMDLSPEARAQLVHLARSFPPYDVLERVQRYEAHLTRQYDATIRQLEHLQSRRAAQSAFPSIPSFDSETTKQTAHTVWSSSSPSPVGETSECARQRPESAEGRSLDPAAQNDVPKAPPQPTLASADHTDPAPSPQTTNQTPTNPIAHPRNVPLNPTTTPYSHPTYVEPPPGWR